MSDSGKHSALRETGDGSFEIVFEDGLDEVSEDEPSFAEATVDSDRAVPTGSSRRFLTIATLSALLFVLVAVGLWFAVSATDSTEGEGADEASAGFRPYGGGAEASAKGVSPGAAEAARKRALAAARAEDDDEEEAVVIEEDEPGWELEEAEEDIVVVEEGEVEEVVEEVEEVEEPSVDEVDGDVGLDPRTRIEPRQAPSLPSNLNMPVKPRVPNLGRAPIDRENLRNLPIRQIDPETGTLEEVEYVEESVGEEYLEESVDEEYLEESVDEEYVEEEPIEEY